MQKSDILQMLLTSLRKASNIHDKVLSLSGQYFEGEKLVMREAHFAVAIGKNTSLTMGQLAAKMQVTAGAVSQMAKVMEEKGFVCRVSGKDDKRVNQIALTEKGERLVDEHILYDKQQFQQMADYFEEFTTDELMKIIQFNQKLADVFMKVIEKRQNS